MAQADLSKPGKRVKKLLCVTADNRNKYYNMFEQDNGTFIARYGRVGADKEAEDTKDISKWDSTYKEKTQRKKEPYTDKTDNYIGEAKVVTTGGAAKKNEMFAPTRHFDTVSFIKELMNHANISVQQNYDVNVTAVTRAQVAAAQALLDKLSAMAKPGQRTDDLNQTLMDLYMTIPRKMKNTKFHLFLSDDKITQALMSRQGEAGSTKDDMLIGTKQGVSQLISLEQDTLDVMAGQVNTHLVEEAADAGSSKTDLLTNLALDCVPVTAQEAETIKKRMGTDARRFIRAYRVNNGNTSIKFDKHVKEVKNKKSDLMWHGSRSENWWSIFQQGLLIRPSGATHTGSMFGDAIYGASKASKSINYTSINNAGRSYTSGGARKAYLALYDFHLGNQYEIGKWKSEHSSLSLNKLKQLGDYDSVYAKAGYDLVNDEFMIYRPQQCTIRYLIEFGN